MSSPVTRRGGQVVKAFVDEKLCQGHARCNLICPEVFDLDEAGFASVIAEVIPPEQEAAVEDAVLNCPERAITTIAEP
jgi:ferredoxin